MMKASGAEINMFLVCGTICTDYNYKLKPHSL